MIDTDNLSTAELARLWREEMAAKTEPHEGAVVPAGRVAAEGDKFTGVRKVGGDYQFKSTSAAVPSKQVAQFNQDVDQAGETGVRYHTKDPSGEFNGPVVTFDSVAARRREMKRRGLFDLEGGDKDCKHGQSNLSTG